MSADTPHPATAADQGRRRFIKLAAVTTTSLVVAACGGEQAAVTNTNLKEAPLLPAVKPGDATATAQASLGKTYFPSNDLNVPDAYTVSPPLTQSVKYIPGQGGKVRAFTIGFKPPVLPRNENKYWQELEKRLNVQWDLTVAPGNEGYVEKSSTLIAAGDLPELFLIITTGNPSLNTALRQGAFTDLTPYLTGDALKNFPNLAGISPATWENMKIEGKIYGVPRPRPLPGGVLVFRNDWAKNVGIPEPKTTDEFFEVMKAFTQSNPEGKNSKTYGLGLLNTYGSNNYFYEMFGIFNSWQLEKNGKLTNYLEVPQFKDAIEYIRKLFAAGVFHPDALTQTQTDAKNGQIAGKFGAYWDGFAGVRTQRSGARKINPTADIGLLPAPAAPGAKPTHWLGTGFYGFTGIPSQYQGNSERISELLRILDYLSAPLTSVEGDFLISGIDDWDNKKNAAGVKEVTQTGQKEIGDLAYISNGVPLYYITEDPEFGPRLQDYTRRLVEMGSQSDTLGIPSETSRREGEKLGLMIQDRLLRIFKGEDPVSAVDTLVKDWLKQGGEQIKAELLEGMKKK